jgi:THO complex subunit 4
MDKALDQVITEKFAAKKSARGNARGQMRGMANNRGNLNRTQKNTSNYNHNRGATTNRGRGNFVRGRGQVRQHQTGVYHQKPIALLTHHHQQAQQVAQHQNLSTKIHVSNLHFEVSELDMQELFGEFGPLKKVAMCYDKEGKSQGVCDIAFESRTNALRAIKKYENVPLDGRKMRIEVIGELKNVAPIQQVIPQRITTIVQPRSHPANRFAPSHRVNKQVMVQRAKNVMRGGAARGGVRGRGGYVARGNSRVQTARTIPEKTESKTEEQLDKELDSYLAKAPNN